MREKGEDQMKRKTAKRSLAAVLSVLTACGNFVFAPFSISAADADATVYLQDLYFKTPTALPSPEVKR